MSNELIVASTEHIEILEPEIVTDDKVFVAGRNWSSMNVRRSVTVEGHTIKEILLDALRREFDKTTTEFQESVWLSRCRCKVNGVEIDCQIASDNVLGAELATQYIVDTLGEGVEVAEAGGLFGRASVVCTNYS